MVLSLSNMAKVPIVFPSKLHLVRISSDPWIMLTSVTGAFLRISKEKIIL